MVFGVGIDDKVCFFDGEVLGFRLIYPQLKEVLFIFLGENHFLLYFAFNPIHNPLNFYVWGTGIPILFAPLLHLDSL